MRSPSYLPRALPLIALALLLAGCPERVYMPKARELIAAAQAGSFKKAYACMSARFRKSVPLARFKEVLERELDIRRAKTRKLAFARKTSNRAGVAEGELQTRRGAISISLVLTRGITDMDYLVDGIAAAGRPLFPEAPR